MAKSKPTPPQEAPDVDFTGITFEMLPANFKLLFNTWKSKNPTGTPGEFMKLRIEKEKTLVKRPYFVGIQGVQFIDSNHKKKAM